MADVFISYSGKSPDAAEAIADELERFGISCWIAKRNIKAGEDFATAINNAIKNCKVFLLVLDKNSSQSPHVANEVSLAFRRVNEGVVLVPFKTENCKISEGIDYYITRFNILEGNPSNAQQIHALIRHIAALLGKKLSMEEPKKQTGMSAKNMVLTIILDLLLIALVVFSVVVPTLKRILEWNENERVAANDVSRETEPETNYIEWTLDNGLLTISGKGRMQDYEYNYDFHKGVTHTTTPWWERKNDIVFVVIKKGVTSIGDNAFRMCDNLTAVTISNSVTSIGDHAFWNCSSLTDVTVPDSVTHIGSLAFGHCSKLKNVSVPAHISDEDIENASERLWGIFTRRET